MNRASLYYDSTKKVVRLELRKNACEQGFLLQNIYVSPEVARYCRVAFHTKGYQALVYPPFYMQQVAMSIYPFHGIKVEVVEYNTLKRFL